MGGVIRFLFSFDPITPEDTHRPIDCRYWEVLFHISHSTSGSSDMRTRYFNFSVFTLIWVAMSCVDPIAIELKENMPKLVIDGYFTTNAAFNTVRISSSANFSNDYPFVPF